MTLQRQEKTALFFTMNDFFYMLVNTAYGVILKVRAAAFHKLCTRKKQQREGQRQQHRFAVDTHDVTQQTDASPPTDVAVGTLD